MCHRPYHHDCCSLKSSIVTLKCVEVASGDFSYEELVITRRSQHAQDSQAMAQSESITFATSLISLAMLPNVWFAAVAS